MNAAFDCLPTVLLKIGLEITDNKSEAMKNQVCRYMT